MRFLRWLAEKCDEAEDDLLCGSLLERRVADRRQRERRHNARRGHPRAGGALFFFVCASTAAALLLSASAAASPLDVALAKAEQLWGARPCGGAYRVEIVQLPSLAAGHASWDSPSGDLYTSPPSLWTDCVLELQAEDWTAEQVSLQWQEDCTTVLHEWGHLTGHPHSDEPGAPPEPPGTTAEQLGVMRSGLGDYSPDTARCGESPYVRSSPTRCRLCRAACCCGAHWTLLSLFRSFSLRSAACRRLRT